VRACYEHIRFLVAEANVANGDFAELGVWHGDTFVGLAQSPAASGRLVHAVDSFQGMTEPTQFDYGPDGKTQFPRGALSVGGSDAFRRRVASLANVRVHEGWVPEVLDKIELPDGLAFAHLDLDQYEPTLAALRWAWQRMNPGGILCCHDWFPGRNYLASGAVCTFAAENNLPLAGESPSRHIWWRKP